MTSTQTDQDIVLKKLWIQYSITSLCAYNGFSYTTVLLYYTKNIVGAIVIGTVINDG